jgi:CheY-like chemotaxis protein
VVGEAVRVLVVDDNEPAADALAMFLALENLSCRATYGGEQSVEMGRTWHPHVIVMDISMPVCNGFDAARALRYEPLTADIAIIAFTALDESHVRAHLEDHEFDAYCQKGQSPDNLLELLLQILDVG